MSGAVARSLREVYRILYKHHGPQRWWPADGPFEVAVGAVLTQNTAWTNVERAIANLRDANCLSPEAIVALPERRLAELLRPSGYFNVKGRRLRALCEWWLTRGGLTALAAVRTPALREALLGVRGVGRETADDILLYAFGRPVFVVDAYTRRLFGRLDLIDPQADYDEIRVLLEGHLGRRLTLFNEYHALVVRHGKDVCRVRPRCAACPVAAICPGALAVGS